MPAAVAGQPSLEQVGDRAAVLGLRSHLLAHRAVARLRLRRLPSQLDGLDEVRACIGGLGHSPIVPHGRSGLTTRPEYLADAASMRAVATAVRLAAAVLATAGLWTAALACGTTQPATEQLRVQVLATLPHDTTMYTQGLEIHKGVLYEGSGLIAQSRVRATALSNAAVLREATLPAPLFGEGLTVADDRLWQLTWKSGTAIERDLATLSERRRGGHPGGGGGPWHRRDRVVVRDRP